MQEGGAGRVTCTMVNELAKLGYEIVICTDTVRYTVFYQLDPTIKIVTYNERICEGNKLTYYSYVIFQLRRLIKQEKPDVILGVEALMFFLTKMAISFTNTPIVAVDHTSMGRNLGCFLNWVRHNYYGSASAISLLTHKDAHILGDKFPQKYVIYNPLSFPVFKGSEQRRNTILCVGRLNAWNVKGFDRILKIWSELSSKYPEWSLEIAGGGSEEAFKEVNAMIDHFELGNTVRLLGQVIDMPTLYQRTRIFALPSRVEGFPMGLVEAMSQGCCCVAFDMQGAVKEIIEDKKSGYIVNDDDVSMFSDVLEMLLTNPQVITSVGQEAVEKCSEFSVDSFVGKWVSVLDGLKK